MVVPIRLANSTWRGVVTCVSVLGSVMLIAILASSAPQAAKYVQPGFPFCPHQNLRLVFAYGNLVCSPALHFNYTGGFMPIAQMILPEFDQEVKNTRKLLECVPDGKLDYKPHEKSMTLGRLAGDVAEITSFGTATIRREKLEMKGGEKPFSPATKKELLETFEKHAAEAREAIVGASDEDLGKIWS